MSSNYYYHMISSLNLQAIQALSEPILPGIPFQNCTSQMAIILSAKNVHIVFSLNLPSYTVQPKRSLSFFFG